MLTVLLASGWAFRFLSYEDIQSRLDKYKLEHGVIELEPDINSTEKLEPRVFLLEQYDEDRPTLLLIGGFHGNQVTGAISIVEFAGLYFGPLKELRKRANVLILPVANPSGYSLARREQTVLDSEQNPNEDFPYDREDRDCCVTNACRTIRWIYDNYQIWLALTIHGGEFSITYPPGDYAHLDQAAPDDQLLASIANSMNLATKDHPYSTGSMNDVVYPLYGAFQDWAYYTGWDHPELLTQCKGSPKDKPEMRGLVILVENGEKTPNCCYGHSRYYEGRDPKYYGYVPRTIDIIETAMDWLSPAIHARLLYDGSAELSLPSCKDSQATIWFRAGGKQQSRRLTKKLPVTFVEQYEEVTDLHAECYLQFAQTHSLLSGALGSRNISRVRLT